MAITAIGSGDLAKIRGPQYPPTVDIFIIKPEVVASATISAVEDLTPLRTLDVTSTSNWTDIEVGMMVHVHDGGGTTRTYATVYSSTSTELGVSLVYTGAPGYPQNIRSAIQVGDTVTVYKHFPLWGLYPTIEENGFYKEGGRVNYSDQNLAPPPIANGGPWQCAFVDVGNSATFTLDWTGSYHFAGNATTISSYLTELPTGVTVNTGTVNSSSLSVNATYGQHLIKQTVTDDNSKTTDCYRWLFVSDSTNYTALSEDYPVIAVRGSRGREGQTVTITLQGSSIDLLPGTAILMKRSQTLDGGSLTAGVEVNTFIGYLSAPADIGHDGEFGTITLTAESPSLYAKRIVQLPQYVQAVNGTPANFAEVKYSISNPFFALYYAIKWHTPNMMRMHDLDAASQLTTPLTGIHNYEGSSLYDAMSLAARHIAGNVGCKSDGTICLRKDPTLRDNTTRNALEVVMTIGQQDLLGKESGGAVQWNKRYTSEAREVRSGAFAWEGENTDAAWYGMSRWEQGISYQQLPASIVTKAQGLDEVRNMTGHYMARINARYKELTIPLRWWVDVFEPAEMAWVGYDLPTTYDPTGEGFDSIRTLPIRLDFEYRFGAYGIEGYSQTLITQPETYGQPSEQWVPGGSPTFTLPITNPFEGDTVAPDSLMAVNDSGYGLKTLNALDATPSWAYISDKIDGNICDMCPDYGSSYFAQGNDGSGKAGAYVASISGTSVFVYHISDMNVAQPSVEKLTTMVLADATATSNPRVECYYYNPDFVAVAAKDDTGVKVRRSDDAGESWSSTTTVGSTVADLDANENAMIGMVWTGDVSNNGVLFITGHDGSTGYGIYKASGKSGSFSAVTSTPRRPTPQSSIIVNGLGDLYVGFPNYYETAYNIPFPIGSSDLFYSFTNNISSSSVYGAPAASGGQPGDCAEFTVTSDNNIAVAWQSELEIDTSSLTGGVKDLTMDVYTQWGTAGSGFEVFVGSGLSKRVIYSIVDSTGTSGQWQTVTLKDLSGFSTASSLIIRINLKSEVGTWRYTDQILRIDNIVITSYDGGNPTVYHCEDPQGLGAGPTWTNVSPGEFRAPRYPHGISVDPVDSLAVDVMAENETDTSWLTSDDGGSSWSLTEADVAYRFVERDKDAYLLAGVDTVATTVDAGNSAQSIVGNMATILPSIGTVKRLIHP